jgi:hypothetical protein
MLRSFVHWAVSVAPLSRCRESWHEASLSFQALLAIMAPDVAEAFRAWAAGLGTAVVAGILCARLMNRTQQWAAGIGALVPVRVQRR